MRRRELIAAVVSSIAAGFLSAKIAESREPHAGLWIAASIGALVGLFTAFVGQTLVEGCVVTCVLAVTLLLLMATPIRWPPWLQEAGIGLLVGFGVGGLGGACMPESNDGPPRSNGP